MGNLRSLKLSPADHDSLDALVRSGTVEARLARRARTVLLLDAGQSVRTTADRVGLAPRMVQFWKRRFLEHGIVGLEDAPRPGRPKVIALRKEARMADTQASAETGHPVSSGTMAARHGVSPSSVTRLWRRHGLQPHRVDAHVASPDPEFMPKAQVILGLYLNPPAHAAVLCVDEKATFKPWIARSRSCRCGRAGQNATALSICAMGRCRCMRRSKWPRGKSAGKCVLRHTSAEFVAFLEQATRGYGRRGIHVIVDNLSAHKTAAVQTWLAKHLASSCTIRRRTARGSIKSRSGSASSSAIASRVASSRLRSISSASSWPTSSTITGTPPRSCGRTMILSDESVSLINDSRH